MNFFNPKKSCIKVKLSICLAWDQILRIEMNSPSFKEIFRQIKNQLLVKTCLNTKLVYLKKTHSKFGLTPVLLTTTYYNFLFVEKKEIENSFSYSFSH